MADRAVHVPIPDRLVRDVALRMYMETTDWNEKKAFDFFHSEEGTEMREVFEAAAREIVKLIIQRLCESDSIRVAHYQQRDDHPELRA